MVCKGCFSFFLFTFAQAVEFNRPTGSNESQAMIASLSLRFIEGGLTTTKWYYLVVVSKTTGELHGNHWGTPSFKPTASNWRQNISKTWQRFHCMTHFWFKSNWHWHYCLHTTTVTQSVADFYYCHCHRPSSPPPPPPLPPPPPCTSRPQRVHTDPPSSTRTSFSDEGQVTRILYIHLEAWWRYMVELLITHASSIHCIDEHLSAWKEFSRIESTHLSGITSKVNKCLSLQWKKLRPFI